MVSYGNEMVVYRLSDVNDVEQNCHIIITYNLAKGFRVHKRFFIKYPLAIFESINFKDLWQSTVLFLLVMRFCHFGALKFKRIKRGN